MDTMNDLQQTTPAHASRAWAVPGVFDLLPDIVELYDERGVLRGANVAWHRQTGHRLQDALGHQPWEFVAGRYHAADEFAAIWTQARRSGRWRGPLRTCTLDGAWLQHDVIVTLLPETEPQTGFPVVRRGMTGMALYELVERAHPDLAERFLFVTGGANLDGEPEFLARVGRPVLQKPFGFQELMNRVLQIGNRDTFSVLSDS